MTDMDDAAITAELTRAQEAVKEARKAPEQRRAAVQIALDHGWTKYRIAAVLGVKGPTVDAIVDSINRHAAAEEQAG